MRAIIEFIKNGVLENEPTSNVIAKHFKEFDNTKI